MQPYRIQRSVEAIVTGRASGTSVAKSDAVATAVERVQAADEGALVAVDGDAEGVYEFPSAPFEPYRVTTVVTLTVEVEADDEAAALDAGEQTIDSLLGRSELEEWSYHSEPTVTG